MRWEKVEEVGEGGGGGRRCDSVLVIKATCAFTLCTYGLTRSSSL